MDNKIGLKLGFKAVRHSFKFSGRSTRTELLSYLLLLALSYAALFVGFVFLVLIAGLPVSEGAGSGVLLLEYVELLLTIVPYLPLLGLLVRRLNDQARSRWWALAWPVAVFAQLISEAAEEELLSLSPDVLELISNALWLPMVILLFLPETIGENRYGPDPRDASSTGPAS